jgi:hypothetical protein
MKEYNTLWVKELPAECSRCGSVLEDNSFTSKKGERWESVKCEGCSIKWMKSKPKTGGSSNGNVIILEEIQNGFKELNDRFDSLAEYLAGKLK